MTDLPRKILLATAGTPASDPELRAAADLSARTGAPVRVVHVGRDLPAPSHYGLDYNLFANDAEAAREVSRLANAQAAMIEERGGTVAEVYSQPGKRLGDEIVKNTRDEDVGLVVVGERGMGPFRYGSRTSITATVVREAFCPVLVVRGWTAGLDQEGFDQGRFPRRVLLATDGTPNAAPAAQKAVEIPRGTGSELHVAHVEARGAEEGRSREVLDGEVGRIEGTGGERRRVPPPEGAPRRGDTETGRRGGRGAFGGRRPGIGAGGGPPGGGQHLKEHRRGLGAAGAGGPGGQALPAAGGGACMSTHVEPVKGRKEYDVG